MTAQLDAPVLDFGRLEEFAGQGPGRPGRGVQRDPGLPRRPARALAGAGRLRHRRPPGHRHIATLAERSGVARRYVQEWLSAQAAHGYVTYDAASETFALSVEAAAVLAEEESPAALIAGFELIAGVWAAVDKLANAYTTGEGLPWHEHDPRVFSSVARFYGTMYRASLLTEWFPAVPGLVERLESGIRVLDVGCGLGVPTILLAEAFPNSTFVGVDYHEESIRLAKAAAVEAGVTDRVQFHESRRHVVRRGVRPGAVLRRRPRPRRPRRRPGPRTVRAPARRPGGRDRAVRRGHPRGEPRATPSPASSTSAARRCACRTASAREVRRWVRRPVRPSCSRPSARPASPTPASRSPRRTTW